MHFLNQTGLVDKQQYKRSDSSDDEEQLNKNINLFNILLSNVEEEDKINQLTEALKQGADINFQDANRGNNTLLHVAVKKEYLEVISYLLKEPSIRVDLRNKKSEIPRDLAAGKEKILAVLKASPPQGPDLVSLNEGEQSFSVLLSHQLSANKEDPLSSRPVLNQQSRKFKRPLEIIERESNIGYKNTKIACLPDGPYPASGVKSSFHGVVYQLKLLMLFAWKGKKKGYSFRLATEMNAAEKFDDVVFQYMKSMSGGISSRFLQAKHIQVDKENIKKITEQDLLTESDDKFSLQKYFISYVKIKRNPAFSGLQDFVICTNINFNFDINFNQQNLKKLSHSSVSYRPLYFETISEEDDILNLGGERYRFVSKDTDEDKRKEVVSELIELFKRTSESKKLAEALAHHLLKDESIGLNNDFFKSYQVPLVRYVIDIRSEHLSKDFLDGNQNCPEVRSFREAFREAVEQHLNDLKELEKKDPQKLSGRDRDILEKKLDSEPPSKKLKTEIGDGASDSFWSKMSELSLKVSDGFKKTLVLDENPNLISPEQYSEEMGNLINKRKKKKILTIQQGDKRGNNILYSEIYKLAGHVLVEDNRHNEEVVAFGSKFLNGGLLKGNLKKFRIKLMNKLKVNNFKDLSNKLTHYTFNITRFQTCRESEFDALLQSQSKIIFPDLQISKEEIEEFMDKLVFAVNQPNEEKLGELISQEIGGEFNLINSDLIADSFQKKMLDWLKEKQGTFETENDIDIFFGNTKKKILQWVMIGPTSEYVTKLEQSGVTFKENSLPNELKEYLNRQNEIKKVPLHLQTEPEQTRLSSIQVNQVIKSIDKYNKQGSYIFVNLKTLLRLQKKVVDAFSGTKSELLIIEYNLQTESMDNLYHDLSTLSGSKQLLFVASEDHPLVVKFPERCIIKNEKCHWQDLTQASQENILKRTANFQGCTVELRQLMNVNSPAAGALPLASLLASERPIEVGKPVPTSDGYDTNFYINRTLNRQITIKAKLFDDLKKFKFNDLIARSQQEFEQLCGQNQSKNVHWLQEEESGQWLWTKSQGSLTNLRKYIRIGQTRRSSHEDVQTFLQNVENHQVMLIADTAGMGKTTVLTHLSKSIKKGKPDFWVVRIDLNRYTDALKAQPGEFTKDSAMEFISEKLLKLDNPLEIELLVQSFRLGEAAPLVLMFDGFDEISPSYKETVINLLTILKSTAIKQLWVTTRPHLKEALEDKLQQLAYTLEPFSETDQINFLIGFWKKKIELSENEASAAERLQDYAHQLVRKLASSIKDRHREFTGIPLQTKMLAESFRAKIKEHLQMEIDTLELPDKLELIDLYEAFIKEKHRIYQSEKLNKDLSNPGVQEEQDSIFENFKKTHQKLAMKSILGEERYRDILTGESDANIPEEKIYRAGLVQVTNGRPHFVHRTFAEYFMADCIVEELRREQPSSEKFQDFILKDISLKEDYQVIRNFINSFLEKIQLPNEKLKQYGDYIYKIHKKTIVDDNGKTFLYIACEEKNNCIFQFLFNAIAVSHKEILTKILSIKSHKIRGEDSIGKMTVLHAAADNGNSDIIKWIIDNLDNNNIKFKLLKEKGKDENTILHVAAKNGNLDIIKWVVQYVNNKESDILQKLSAGNRFGYSFLELLARERRHKDTFKEVIEFLEEENKKILEKLLTSSQHLFDTFVLRGDSSMVKWFLQYLDKPDKLNKKTKNEILIELLYHKNNVSDTPLRRAVSLGLSYSGDIAINLLGHMTDINNLNQAEVNLLKTHINHIEKMNDDKKNKLLSILDSYDESQYESDHAVADFIADMSNNSLQSMDVNNPGPSCH